jgi:hypothetical protein
MFPSAHSAKRLDAIDDDNITILIGELRQKQAKSARGQLPKN